MANWHYYNNNGEKVGPISVAALKELAAQGLITRETKIENHTGRTALAGTVNGLMFPEETTPLDATSFGLPAEGGVYGFEQESLASNPTPFHALNSSFPAPYPFTPSMPTPMSDSVPSIQYEYKCVAAPKTVDIEVNNWGEEAAGIITAIASYGALINKECYDRWEFYSMEQITVTVYIRLGCLAFLFAGKSGPKKTTISNMLVFRRQK